MSQILNIPNILTMSRIVLLPGFMGGFYVESQLGLIISFVIFIICCITDYLDGYIARTYKQTTKIGKMLDPLADKILILISILYIVGFGMVSKSTLIPAAITLCRELIITGLRESVTTSGKNFNTSYISKCKTASQMIAISVIFISYILKINSCIIIGEVLLWLSSLLAIISGLKYFTKFLNQKT